MHMQDISEDMAHTHETGQFWATYEQTQEKVAQITLTMDDTLRSIFLWKTSTTPKSTIK